MTILLGLLTALIAASACLGISLVVADRLFSGARFEVRLVAGLCLGYWTAAWAFQVLALLGIFRVGLLAVMVWGVALVLFRGSADARKSLRILTTDLDDELSRLRADLWRRRWVALALAAIGVHVAIRMLRTLATPAFGWDDFTYHLFRAGRWVQNGGLFLEPAPDAWTYYEFFPWGGDLLWAWALVWGTGDVLVPVVAVALWAAVWVAAYAVVRELGPDRSIAAIVATAVAVIPSQVSQMSTAYVDNAVLVMVLSASLFLLIYLRSDGAGGTPAAALVGVACGLGLMVKMSFLPLLMPAALIVAWRALRQRRWQPLVGFAAGLAVALPNLLFNWIQRGSPFYPFEILDALPFNEQHSWILSKYGEGASAAELTRAGKALVVNLFPLDPFLNMGLVGLLLVALGTLGAVKLGQTGRGRWFLLWAVIGAALTFASFFSPRNSSMVVWWTLMMGRFLVPSLAGLMVAASLVPGWVLRGILLPALVIEYFLYARRGWPPEQLLATAKVAALLAVLIGLAVLIRRRRGLPFGVLLPVAMTLVLLGVIGVREQYRYDAYRLFADRQLLDFHGAPPMSAWPIWRRLDQTGPQRVAATAGFDGLTGHNWFRAALLGPWLENQVVYLPVTTDGRLVSYRDREALVAAADRRAWLARVAEQGVDRVVALGPANIEHRWMLDLPEIFEIEIRMGNDHFLLARVHHDALARHLGSAD